MMDKVIGKGSAMANNRIMKEYKSLSKSEEFKGVILVSFIKDNIYTWHVEVDLTLYECHPKLKEDISTL